MADLLGTATPWEGELSTDDKTWGMFCHLSALLGYIIPFGTILGPLICWQMKKNESTYIDDHGKESMNFMLTILIAYIVCGLLSCLIIGLFLLPVVAIFDVVLRIIAGIKANEGNHFVYPFTIRFIK